MTGSNKKDFASTSKHPYQALSKTLKTGGQMIFDFPEKAVVGQSKRHLPLSDLHQQTPLCSPYLNNSNNPL